MGLVTARCRQRHFQGVGDVFGLHRRAELPGDDIAREVIEDRGEIQEINLKPLAGVVQGHFELGSLEQPVLARQGGRCSNRPALPTLAA
jgi:hypothetical protein